MSSATDMTAFVRAVELGGFSVGGARTRRSRRRRSRSWSRASRTGSGVRLLNRTTRRLALTPEGEAYFARSQRILADIAEAENEVARLPRAAARPLAPERRHRLRHAPVGAGAAGVPTRAIPRSRSSSPLPTARRPDRGGRRCRHPRRAPRRFLARGEARSATSSA